MIDVLKIKVERYDNPLLPMKYVAFVDESDLPTERHRFTGLVVQGHTALDSIFELHKNLQAWESYKKATL